MQKFISVVFILALLTGCSSDSDNSRGMLMQESAAVSVSRERDQYLAYEHWLRVEINAQRLPNQFESVIGACASDQEHKCTVLDSQIAVGEYSTASVRMRLSPEGVDDLIVVASENGEILEKTTHVEDLEKTITDTNKRIEMLTATRDKLLEIESRAVDDVDSLIKVASELTRVQSELEQLHGYSASQQQRVDKHILTIQYTTTQSVSFLKPIYDAFSDFGSNLSEGIGDTVTAVAYLLPWSILLFVIFLIIRRVWRRTRAK